MDHADAPLACRFCSLCTRALLAFGHEPHAAQTDVREEFFEWADAQEERYEFDGEQPVLMTGGTILHSKLMGRLLAQLLVQIDGAAFEVLGPAGVATAGNRIRYPDVVVGIGSTLGIAQVVQNPIAVFEIVSASSSRTDRIVKLREYGAVVGIRHYAILETEDAAFEKQADNQWIATGLTAEDRLAIPALGVGFSVAELYEGLLG